MISAQLAGRREENDLFPGPYIYVWLSYDKIHSNVACHATSENGSIYCISNWRAARVRM